MVSRRPAASTARRLGGTHRTAFFAVAMGLFAAAPVHAQSAPPSPGARPSETASPASPRDAEYAAVAREAALLERELGLVKRVVKLVTPAVVHIEARSRLRNNDPRQVEEAGSGVIVEFGGRPYILTNRHVIGRSTPESIDIHLADGRVFHPTQVWSDNRTDVAVMAIGAINLPSARLGNSDALEIGDYVLAIGSPFGLSQSVTRGIVSAKGRHNLSLGENELLLQDFIQTDAAINPGNSGGPLVNLRGEVIGLNTAIASASGGNEGVGFTVPVNIAARVAQALVEGRDVPRGYLGVDLDGSFNTDRARALGLPSPIGTLIKQVKPQSPAETAQLRAGDVIVQFNGIRVEQDSHLISLVKLSDIGRKVELVVIRDGKPIALTVQIGDERNALPVVENAASRRVGN